MHARTPTSPPLPSLVAPDASMGSNNSGDDSSNNSDEDSGNEAFVADVHSRLALLNHSLEAAVEDFISKARAIAHGPAAVDVLSLPAGVKIDGCNQSLVSALTDLPDPHGHALDSLLHHIIVSHIHKNVLRGDCISLCCDPDNKIQKVFEQISKTRSWAAAEHWRFLTASSTDNPDDIARWDAWLLDAVPTQTRTLLYALALAFRQAPDSLQPMEPAIQETLTKLYEQAKSLSDLMRRNPHPERLSATAPIIGPVMFFKNSEMGSVWDVGDKNGDLLLALYDFGLCVTKDHGVQSYLARPRVATTALLRLLAQGAPPPSQGTPSQHRETPLTSMQPYHNLHSWEDLVYKIHGANEEDGVLWIYLQLHSGQMARETSEICTEKLPNMLLQFYQENIRWKEAQ